MSESNIITQIDDLIHQAETERSHYYTANTLRIARVHLLRSERTARERDALLKAAKIAARTLFDFERALRILRHDMAAKAAAIAGVETEKAIAACEKET